VHIDIINYRKSGAAFENKLAIIPVYSGTGDKAEMLQPNYFVAKLEHTPDLKSLTPLTSDQIKERNNMLRK